MQRGLLPGEPMRSSVLLGPSETALGFHSHLMSGDDLYEENFL